MLDLCLLPLRYDQPPFADQNSEPEDDPECRNCPEEAEEQDVLEILAEVLLLQVVAPREDHGRQQPIKEDLFVEVDLVHEAEQRSQEPEEQSDDDADAGLMQVVPLDGGGSTCLCSMSLPSRMYRIIMMIIPIRMNANSSMFILSI